MKRNWKIGDEFKMRGTGFTWRVTDVGSRVFVAIQVTGTCQVVTMKPGSLEKTTIERDIEPSDLRGPPYSCVEHVFDEYAQDGILEDGELA